MVFTGGAGRPAPFVLRFALDFGCYSLPAVPGPIVEITSKTSAMCLYPRIIENRKYKPNKKNGGVVPECTDDRVKAVAVGCGQCIECRKQKAREWQVRINEEIRSDPRGKFMIEKVSPTPPRYPRAFAKIKKQPL